MDSAKRVSNKMATSEPVAKKPRLSGNSSEPLEDYSSGGATTAPPTTKVKVQFSTSMNTSLVLEDAG